MGSTFVYLSIYIALIFLYLLMTPLSRFFSSINVVKAYLGKQLFMKYMLIMFFSQYPPMLLSSLINIYDINFDGLLETVSTSVSLVLFAVLPSGLVATYLQIRKYRSGLTILEDQGFQERYSELISADHRANIVGSYWKVIVTFRWTLTLIVLVFARDHYECQIMMLLALSILF